MPQERRLVYEIKGLFLGSIPWLEPEDEFRFPVLTDIPRFIQARDGK